MDHCIGLYLDDNDGGIGGDQYYGITPYSVHLRSCIYVLWLVIEVFLFYLLKHLISLIVTFHRPMSVKAYGTPAPVIFYFQAVFHHHIVPRIGLGHFSPATG